VHLGFQCVEVVEEGGRGKDSQNKLPPGIAIGIACRIGTIMLVIRYAEPAIVAGCTRFSEDKNELSLHYSLCSHMFELSAVWPLVVDNSSEGLTAIGDKM
jgi:hypothetical protein